MRKSISRTPLAGVRRKEESVLFRRVSVDTPAHPEVARVRLGELDIALTAAADPIWVAALLGALESRR
jgi:hypothetical protein